MAVRDTEQRIIIGNVAGHCFHGQADLEVVRHCRDRLAFGHYHVRKRLLDGGWEVDRWFDWPRGREK